MDVQYVNPFIQATIETYRTMLSMEASPGTPSLKHDPTPRYDVSGIIGLSGDGQGSISLNYTRTVAEKTVSALVGEEISLDDPALSDGVGELANIIAGSAKQHLNGLNLHISLPNVIIGTSHTITVQKDAPTLLVPFTTGVGEFTMEVALKTT